MDHYLLNVLRESVYGDIRTFWQNKCTPEDRDWICKYCMETGLAPYLYRNLHDLLPDEYKITFKQQYTANSLHTIKYQHGLNELCRIFEQNQVRFCVMKGGDYAFTYYPDPAMRYFCDLDIWIHPDDCTKMLDLLKQNGWKAPYLNTKQIKEHYHYTPHQKNGVVLEPHWAPSSFQGYDPVKLWQDFLTLEPQWQYRYRMTPEVKLLALCRHFSTEEYRHTPRSKFLLDVAWIIRKETVDWEKLRTLSAGFHFESCNDLLGSQDEFFPPEIIKAIAPDPEMAQTFRRLFELQEQLPKTNCIETQMQANGKFSALWFLARFRGIHPLSIRRKYKLPEKGSHIRVLRMMIYDIFIKITGIFQSLFKQDTTKKEYNRLLRKINNRAK
jgi:hypothetical protein